MFLYHQFSSSLRYYLVLEVRTGLPKGFSQSSFFAVSFRAFLCVWTSEGVSLHAPVPLLAISTSDTSWTGLSPSSLFSTLVFRRVSVPGSWWQGAAGGGLPQWSCTSLGSRGPLKSCAEDGFLLLPQQHRVLFFSLLLRHLCVRGNKICCPSLRLTAFVS